MFRIVEVAEKNFVVDCCPKLSRLEEVHRIKIGNVNSPRVGWRTLATVLLDMHAKEADIGAVNLFESEQCFGSIRKLPRHIAVVNETTLHTRFDFDDLVARGNDPNRHLASAGFFLFQEVIDSRFDIRAELRHGQALRAEFVIFALLGLLLKTIITSVSTRKKKVY